ncbi:MAG: HAMP domain-containing protein [Bacteroidetes bacterium]|nr:HAMP domain-containing protein [Bacteroidota bacterium]
MKRISISDKLNVYFFFLSVVIISIVALYSFYNAKKVLLERTFNQLTSVRVVKKDLIEQFIGDQLREIKLIACSDNILKITSQINKHTNPRLPYCLKLSKNESSFIQQINPEYYTQIAIVGRNRSCCFVRVNVPASYSKGGLNDTRYINYLWNRVSEKNGLYIDDLRTLPDTNLSFLHICSPIIDIRGGITGIMIFEVPLAVINTIMLEKDSKNGLGFSGESYLVGSDFLMRSTSRFQKNSVLKTVVKTEGTINTFHNKPGTKTLYDYRNIFVLSSFSKVNIPDLNWAILAEIDFEEAIIPIYRIRDEIVFLSIFITIAVFIIITFISRRITLPIKKLNSAATRISEGNFDTKLTVSSKDEIGELTQTFNTMVEKLDEQAKELKSERAKRLRSMIDGQELEQQRLSRELHDSLGQQLIALKLKLENIETDSLLSERILTDIKKSFDNTIEDIKRISNNLMPSVFDEFGMITSIRNLCDELSELGKTDIQFSADNIPGNLNKLQKIYIFRIIQEGLNNILKHAQASNASVNLSCKDSVITIIISDNGKGFLYDTKINEFTHGLLNMTARVSLLQGTISFDSQINAGTCISITLPVKTNKIEKD